KVFAYMKGNGYVGFGEVDQPAAMVRDFVPAGQTAPLLELPLAQEKMKHHPDDPDLAEWAVGVKWSKTFPRDQPRRLAGAFANQNIVCKLRDPRTLEFLKREFEVQD